MRLACLDGDWQLSQGYGCTDLAVEPADPRHPECPHFHQGIDIPTPMRTPVLALDAGTVTFADALGELRVTYDNLAGKGSRDVWCFHLDEIVAFGKVAKGELIAYTGMKGNATGPHLHIEVEDCSSIPTPVPYGNAERPYHSIDPMPFLTEEEEMQGRGLDSNTLTLLHHLTQDSLFGFVDPSGQGGYVEAVQSGRMTVNEIYDGWSKLPAAQAWAAKKGELLAGQTGTIDVAAIAAAVADQLEVTKKP